MQFHSLKPSGHYIYHLLQHIKICILPTEYICVIHRLS
jgi:hypothetical protein